MEINGEVVLHPRNYEGADFEMLSGSTSFAFRQNAIHGGRPIAIFRSSKKGCTFFGDCTIPNLYNKSSIGTVISNIYTDVHIKNRNRQFNRKFEYK